MTGAAVGDGAGAADATEGGAAVWVAGRGVGARDGAGARVGVGVGTGVGAGVGLGLCVGFALGGAPSPDAIGAAGGWIGDATTPGAAMQAIAKMTMTSAASLAR